MRTCIYVGLRVKRPSLSPRQFLAHWVISGLSSYGGSLWATDALEKQFTDGQTEHTLASLSSQRLWHGWGTLIHHRHRGGGVSQLWAISNHLCCPDLAEQTMSCWLPRPWRTSRQRRPKEAELGCPGISVSSNFSIAASPVFLCNVLTWS